MLSQSCHSEMNRVESGVTCKSTDQRTTPAHIKLLHILYMFVYVCIVYHAACYVVYVYTSSVLLSVRALRASAHEHDTLHEHYEHVLLSVYTLNTGAYTKNTRILPFPRKV